MSEMYWKLVDLWANNNALLDKYWNDERLIYGSNVLAGVIKKLEPRSVYEIGMYNGRNLNVIRSMMPSIRLGGCDVNSVALEFARSRLPKDIVVENFDALNVDITDKYDIVFTHGVLMHIAPDKIRDVIKRILQKSNRYLVHVERGGQNNVVYMGPKQYNPDVVSKELRWSPDISGLYKILGYRSALKYNALFGSKRHETIVIIDKELTYI